nr:ATP synthase F0 subunit 8 [Themira lucida]
MPQMAPISWLSLFIMFSITFLLFNILNYYSFLPTSPKQSESSKIHSSPFNWKW